jgi:hypothetical protein
MKSHLARGHTLVPVESLHRAHVAFFARALGVLRSGFEAHSEQVIQVGIFLDHLEKNLLLAQANLVDLSDTWHAAVSDHVASLEKALMTAFTTKRSKLEARLLSARAAVAELATVLPVAEAEATSASASASADHVESEKNLTTFYVSKTVERSLRTVKYLPEVRVDLPALGVARCGDVVQSKRGVGEVLSRAPQLEEAWVRTLATKEEQEELALAVAASVAAARAPAPAPAPARVPVPVLHGGVSKSSPCHTGAGVDEDVGEGAREGAGAGFVEDVTGFGDAELLELSPSSVRHATTPFRKYWQVCHEGLTGHRFGHGLAASCDNGAEEGWKQPFVVVSDNAQLTLFSWDHRRLSFMLQKVSGLANFHCEDPSTRLRCPVAFDFHPKPPSRAFPSLPTSSYWAGHMGFVSHHGETVLCVTDAGSDSLYALNLSTMTLRGMIKIPNPRAVATRNNLVAVSSWWVDCTCQVSLCEFDSRKLQALTLLRKFAPDIGCGPDTLLVQPMGLCFSRDCSELVVADSQNRRLCVLRVSDMSFKRTIVKNLPGLPMDVALHHGSLVFVCCKEDGGSKSSLCQVSGDLAGRASVITVLEIEGFATASASINGVGLFIRAATCTGRDCWSDRVIVVS